MSLGAALKKNFRGQWHECRVSGVEADPSPITHHTSTMGVR
jgi:hypothetical protein